VGFSASTLSSGTGIRSAGMQHGVILVRLPCTARLRGLLLTPNRYTNTDQRRDRTTSHIIMYNPTSIYYALEDASKLTGGASSYHCPGMHHFKHSLLLANSEVLQKWRDIYLDLAIGVGIPLLILPLRESLLYGVCHFIDILFL
jgi:hypothetical protein